MKEIDYRVYGVTTPIEGGFDKLKETCEKLFKSGLRVLQLRDKEAPPEELLRQAIALRELADRYGASLIVNDNVMVAKEANAAGVHLGQEDMSIAEARKILGPEKIIGISVRSQAEAAAASDAKADYLGANGIFPSKTKKDLEEPLGIERLRELRSATKLPLIAIGGINETNAREIIQAGADGVALVSALIKAEDVAEAYKKILEEVNRGLERRHQTELSMRSDINKGLH